MKPDGTPIYVNNEFLRMTGFSSEKCFFKHSEKGYFWRNIVPSDELEDIETLLRHDLSAGKPTRREHRLIMRPGSRQDPDCQWVEAVSFPEFDAYGRVVAVQGWVMDISHRKLAERLSEQRLQDALKTKNAADKFIDMGEF